MLRNIYIIVAIVGLFFVFGCGNRAEQPTGMTEAPFEAESTLETPSTSLQEETAGMPSGEETISEESLGPQVRQLPPAPKDIQQALKNAGFYEGAVDGKMGPKTKQAIRDFQTQNSLKVDGKVGPRTWEKLKVHLASEKTQSKIRN